MTRPPRIAVWLLTSSLRPDERDGVIGDLDEQFFEQVQARGPARARRWYWQEAILLAWRLRRGHTADGSNQHGPQSAGSTMRLVDTFVHIARDSARQLRHGRMTTLVVVLSLALGIGANTAVFSILNSLVLRQLPVPEPERLVQLQPSTTQMSWTNPQWEQIRDRAELVDSAAAWALASFNLAERGESDPVAAYWVSGNFFKVMGVRPELGRLLTPDDDVRGGGPEGFAVVVSHGFWQRRMGGLRDAIGKRLTLDRTTVTVVGVTPPEFFGPEVGRTFDVIVPLAHEALSHGRAAMLDQRASWWLWVIARLKPGGSPESLEAALRSAQGQMREATLPSDFRPEELAAYFTEPLVVRDAARGSSYVRSRYRAPLNVIMAIVGLVLLMACANIANLLLARTETRQREFAVRLALGASRGRLMGQLLAESLLLSGVGTIAGMTVAYWTSRLLISQLTTPGNTVFLAMPVDWRVLAFLAAIAVATALLFGTAPALGATRVQPTHGLHLRSRTPGSSSGRLSGAFVVAQVALSLVLVVGAGLLVRSFVALSGRPLGFDPDAIMTVTLSARPSQTTKDPAAVRVRRILDAVQATPGVAAAAFGQLIPTSGSSTATWFENPDGRSLSQSERQVSTNRVSPGWFATMGTRVLAGRDFEWSDTADAETRIVINDSLVRTFFPDVNPVGQTLREVGRPNHVMPALTVIGVVEDAVYVSARDGTPPTMYRLLPAASHLMVRAAKGPGGALKNSIAGAIARTDPDFLMTFRPLSEHVRATLARERILATLSGFFGALALLVAALGVYGVMASAVTRQRAEIGLRRALGATERNIFGLVVKRGMRLVGLGVTIGAVISLWAAGTLQTLLFSVSPRDPIAIAGAASVLVTVSFTAIWLPSRRASRLDPAIALREE